MALGGAMRIFLQALVLLLVCLAGETGAAGLARAADSACGGLTGFYVDAGNPSFDKDDFDAGDDIWLRGTGDIRIDPDRSTFGGTPVTTLPFEYRVPKTGTVAWMLYTEGTSGRLKFTCVSDDLLTLAGSWIVVASALSGVLLLAILMTGVRLAVASVLLGVLTTSLLASLRPLPGLTTGFAILDNQYVTMIGLGTAGGLVACLVMRLAVSLRSGMEMFNWRQRAEEARHLLMPSCWPIAAGKPLSPRDVVRRWFVVISASTGGMVASLGGLDELRRPHRQRQVRPRREFHCDEECAVAAEERLPDRQVRTNKALKPARTRTRTTDRITSSRVPARVWVSGSSSIRAVRM